MSISEKSELRQWLSRLWAADDCFLALVPANRAGAVAFSDVYRRTPSDSCGIMARHNEMPVKKALAFYSDPTCASTPARTSLSPQPSDLGSVSSDSTLDDADLVPTITGAYVFSFDLPPSRRKLGWFAGVSLSAKFQFDAGATEADLVLTLNSSQGVKKGHLLFSFLPDSGNFAIRNLRQDSQVALDSRTIPHKKWAPLLTPQTVLTVGELSYYVVWTVPQTRERDFASRRNKYITADLGHEIPIHSISSTPKPEAIRVGSWTLQDSAGKGTESVFFSAVGPQGELAAIRQIVRRDPRSAELAEAEIHHFEEIKSRLRTHNNRKLILSLRDAIFSSGTRNFLQVSAPAADIAHLVLMPLARGDFYSILLSPNKIPTDLASRTLLFAQAILGIAALHEVGYVHRDVKPANLGVVSLNPPTAVVLDLGQAEYIPQDTLTGLECTPGKGGTIGFLAPEQEVEGGRYGKKVDAFAMGCVGFWLFTGRRLFPWRFNPFRDPLQQGVSREEEMQSLGLYNNALAQLKDHSGGAIDRLLYGLGGTSGTVTEGTTNLNMQAAPGTARCICILCRTAPSCRSESHFSRTLLFSGTTPSSDSSPRTKVVAQSEETIKRFAYSNGQILRLTMARVTEDIQRTEAAISVHSVAGQSGSSIDVDLPTLEGVSKILDSDESRTAGREVRECNTITVTPKGWRRDRNAKEKQKTPGHSWSACVKGYHS